MRLQSILFLFLSVIVITLLTTCDEKEDSIPPFLTIDTKNVNFNSMASAREIDVKTSSEDWTATVQSGAQSWLEAIRRGNTLKIVVSENKELNSRKAEIKVVAGNLTETISVEQLGTEPAILLSSELFTVSADGEDIFLEITSNIDYDVVIQSDIKWVKLKAEPRSVEMVKKEYQFEVAWNREEIERRTELLVQHRNGTLQKKVIIVQKRQEGYTGGPVDDIKDDIKVPVNNASASSFQPGGEIGKSFDNNYETNYHSNWTNSDPNYFPITLDYHFQNQESIDYLVYHPRTDGGSNGHFKEVEIWAATESEPVLKKLSEYDFKGSGSPSKIKFQEPLIKPKTIRFVVKSGMGDKQGFASCAEMEFYRANPDNFDPSQLFTDLSCSQLKPGVGLNDIEKISSILYRNIALYLFNNKYPREFRIQEYKAWPHPDEWANLNKTNTLSLLDNPTGIAVSQGEELVAFVDDTHGYMLSLKIQNLDKAGGDGYEQASYYPLTTGVNKIKAQNKGLVYLFYHTSDWSVAPPVTVHFATGEVNGYFDSQKHTESDWNRLLSNATNKYFDVVGKYAHLTFETAAFKTYAANNGPQLIAAYDELVRLEKEFMGLMKYNRPPVNRAYFHVMYSSYMYATSYRTAYETGTQKDILTFNNFKSNPWGPAHELGHTFQTRPGFRWLGMTEVTNNMHSLYVQTEWGNSSRLETEKITRYNNRYEKAYYSSFVHRTAHPGEEDVFCKLVSLWQLQLYFSNAHGLTDTYKDLYERVRRSPGKPNAGEQQLDFVRMMCDITQTDLTGFFTRWGYLIPFDGTIDDYGTGRITVTQSLIDQLVNEIKGKNYAPMTEKIEYICDSNWEFFRDRLPVQSGSATKNGVNIEMKGWKNVVAYEVYEGDNLVFVTNKNSFTLDNPLTNSAKVYAVAYNGNKIEVTF